VIAIFILFNANKRRLIDIRHIEQHFLNGKRWKTHDIENVCHSFALLMVRIGQTSTSKQKFFPYFWLPFHPSPFFPIQFFGASVCQMVCAFLIAPMSLTSRADWRQAAPILHPAHNLTIWRPATVDCRQSFIAGNSWLPFSILRSLFSNVSPFHRTRKGGGAGAAIKVGGALSSWAPRTTGTGFIYKAITCQRRLPRSGFLQIFWPELVWVYYYLHITKINMKGV